MWISCIGELSKDYRTYAVDNIYDFGRSIYTKTVKDSNDFVSWLDELFNALKLENDINLMGLSYGGWLTSQYALQFSERLNKIVLLVPAATVVSMQLGFLARLIWVPLPFSYFTRSFIYWLFEDYTKKDKKAVEDIAGGISLAFKCFKSKRLPNTSILTDDELKSIKVPALYLIGKNEKEYSAKKAVQRLNNVAPQIKTEIIPDAGHDLLTVQTELVNKRVLEFLKHP